MPSNNVFNTKSVLTKLMLLVAIAMVTLIASVYLLMNRVRRANIELVGFTAAETLTNQVLISNRFYSSEILPRARLAGAEASHAYAETETQVPIPATRLKIEGELFSAEYPGSLVRTYSEFPFKFRGAMALDTFDQDALAAVKRDPTEPFYEIINTDGQSSIRYVSAMVMAQGCVDCHNSHPDSPKTDWRVGDVRGGLEVIVPIESAETGIVAGMRQLLGIVSLGMLTLAGAIGLVIQRTVVQPVESIIAVADEVQAGRFNERAPVMSDDELGVMAQHFNSMLDRTIVSMESVREQNVELESSISELLEDVALVSDGDLTVRAKGSHERTRPIADAFNSMLAQMRRIIRDVQETSQQVNVAAAKLQLNASHLEEASNHQADQIHTTVAAVASMTNSIQQVSENSIRSATIGEQARVSAERGVASVKDTVEGMSRIEEQIVDTSRRVQNLYDNSLEISQMVVDIEDIAERTTILALNASIQASKAGVQGSSFGVIAEEVSRLASHSATAANSIAQLVERNQQETDYLVSSIKQTTNEVTKGTELARKAGNALEEIRAVSDQFAELSQVISQSAKIQATTSESLSNTLQEIATITQQNASGTQQTSSSIQQLNQLTDELRQSVSIFQVRNGTSKQQAQDAKKVGWGD